jgi:predicted dehydrogenase
VRVALFGLGAMGRHHARHLEALGVDLVVVDPALGLGPAGNVDAAVIAVPTPLHAEVALPLLERGVPCLVEKPLAGTVADAEALACFPHLAVGHVERFNPALAALAGEDIRFVQAERLAAFTPRGTDVDVVFDLMIHDLDLFLHLAGDEVSDVRANGVAVATGALDLVQARVETRSGRVATFTASRVSRKKARWFRAFAPGAYWSLDLAARAGVRVVWGQGGLEETPVPVADVDPLRAELEAFLSAVRGEAPFRPDGREALAAVRLADRIRTLCHGS